MPFRLVEPGVIEVVYSSPAELAADAQGPLVELLEAECAVRPTVLVFDVKNVTSVPMAVPELWLTVTRGCAPRLCGMAIASPSMAVRAAADGFNVANLLRRVPVAVKSFHTVADATAWARQKLVETGKHPPMPARG